MKRRKLTASALLAAGVVATCVFAARRADAVDSRPVPVTIGSGYASGGMGSARNSTNDGSQEISCATMSSSGSVQVYCFAVDANGQSAGCTYTNPAGLGLVMGGLPSATENEQVDFQWDSQGNCTLIALSNYGYLEPKAP